MRSEVSFLRTQVANRLALSIRMKKLMLPVIPDVHLADYHCSGRYLDDGRLKYPDSIESVK